MKNIILCFFISFSFQLSAVDMKPVKEFVDKYELGLKIKVKNQKEFLSQNDVFYVYPYVRIFDRTFPELQLFLYRGRQLIDFRLCKTNNKIWVHNLGKIPYEIIPRFLNANQVNYQNAILEIGIDGRKGMNKQVPFPVLMKGKLITLNLEKNLPGVKKPVPFKLGLKPIPMTDLIKIRRQTRRAIEKLLDKERIETLKIKAYSKGQQFEKYNLPEDRKEPW